MKTFSLKEQEKLNKIKMNKKNKKIKENFLQLLF